MEPPNVKRTMMAQQALETSALLNLRFAGAFVGSAPQKRLIINTPDGPSTDGGKKARQSVTLTSVDDTQPSSTMCGWIDVSQKQAELRTYRIVSAQYAQRHHTAFDVSQGEYDGLMREAQALLQMQGYVVNVFDELSEAAAPLSAVATKAGVPSNAGANFVIGLTIVGIFAALGTAAYLFLR